MSRLITESQDEPVVLGDGTLDQMLKKLDLEQKRKQERDERDAVKRQRHIKLLNERATFVRCREIMGVIPEDLGVVPVAEGDMPLLVSTF